MDKRKGFEYTIEGHSDIHAFAKGVLILVNYKSSVPDSIVDFRTYQDTNKLSVVTAKECDDFLEGALGEITSKEEIDLVEFATVDLNSDSLKALDKLENDFLDHDKGFHPIFNFKE